MIKYALYLSPILLWGAYTADQGAYTLNEEGQDAIPSSTIKEYKAMTNLDIYYSVGKDKPKNVIDLAIDNIPKITPLLPKQSYKQRYCLAQNIYHEANTEPLKGQILVGKATISRVLSKEFPNSLCGVVYQKNQMSWTKSKQKVKKRIPKKYLSLADDILWGRYGDITYYYTNWFNTKLDSVNTHNGKILTGRKKGIKLNGVFSVPDSNHIFIAYKRTK